MSNHFKNIFVTKFGKKIATSQLDGINIHGMKIISDLSDVYEFQISTIGRVNIYRDAKLIGYDWSFYDSTFRVTFSLIQKNLNIDFVFSGIKNIECMMDSDPGILREPKHIEFEHFVFGGQFIDQPLAPSFPRNIEFATNILSYRFFADNIQALVSERKAGDI